MGNVNKCQDVKRSADYRAADGQDAKQFVGVIDAAVKANFDFQGHPSDFRAADTNSDHFISKTELADILTKMGSTSDAGTAISIYDATKMRSDNKWAIGDTDGKISLNEFVNCGGRGIQEDAISAHAEAEVACPCDIPKCPDVTVPKCPDAPVIPACPAAPACNLDNTAVLEAIANVPACPAAPDCNLDNTAVLSAIADLKTSMAAEIQSAIQTAVDTILTSTDSIKTAVDSVNSSIVTSEVNTATTIGAAKDMITSILGAEIKNAIYESNVTCSVYSSETGKHLGEIKNNDDNGKHVGQIKNGTIDAEDVNHVQGGPNQGENAGIEDELDVLAADLATDAAFYAEEAMLDA